jgi:uncharacterized membrane protein YedE/YeeE
VNVAGIIAFALFVIGAALFLAQLWLQIWPPETFFKLVATDGVLFVVAVVVAFLLRERRESERLRKNRELD